MSFTLLAFLAAALYALNAPLSKLLLQDVSPAMMAAFLYLGAGIGMLAIGLIRSCVRRQPFRLHFTRKDAPYVAGMTALDVAAPILLMLGLTMTSSASASLLNNFEIVATTLIAMLLFREKISKRLWLAIGLITLSGVLLSLDEGGSLHFSSGSLLILLACVCWDWKTTAPGCSPTAIRWRSWWSRGSAPAASRWESAFARENRCRLPPSCR